MRKLRYILLSLTLLLAACTPAKTDPTHTPVPTDTNTPQPSATETPEIPPTATVIPSDTPPPTDTPPSTALDFSNVTIVSYGDTDDGPSFITFEGLDLTGLELWILGFSYKCSIPDDQPNYLTCIGPRFLPGTPMLVEVIEEGMTVHSWVVTTK